MLWKFVLKLLLCKRLSACRVPLVGLCSLTEEGAEAIARVAEKAHLKELNLYMNDIGDAGIFKVPPTPYC